MKRRQSHDSTHLTLNQRKIIQVGIENNSTKAAIARNIGKDATTIAKEIRNHRQFKPRNTFNRPVLCSKLSVCSTKPCLRKCERFEDPKCTRRDKSPGACNQCERLSKCIFDKYFYSAVKADDKYHQTLVDCREGYNLSKSERDAIAKIIAPLLKQGQSVHQILSSHLEISQCEKTIYTYIENGLFKEFGVDNFSLKEQVNRKLQKKYKKRREPINFEGRKYSDFLEFRALNPETPVVQMDTVYNSPLGPYLQTFLFEKTAFMIGFIHNAKTNDCMSSSIDNLQKRLDSDLFAKLFPVLLTDRGSEFEKYQLFEMDKDGNSRLSIFYCDPMQSSQKPHIENNHNYVRDIIPNSYPLASLTQKEVDLMFSHINSTPRRSLGEKSPLEVFNFLYGETSAGLLNINKIDRDDVVLKPSLIFAKNVRNLA